MLKKVVVLQREVAPDRLPRFQENVRHPNAGQEQKVQADPVTSPEGRDRHIDVCKSFLVLGMILFHVLITFYQNGTYTHASYGITIGFILYSGFIVAAANRERIIRDFAGALGRIWIRAGKLLVIFILCNLLTSILDHERFNSMASMGFWRLSTTAVLLNNQRLLAFDVLVPIALTQLLAPFAVLAGISRFRALLGSLVLTGLIAYTEFLEPLNLRGLHLLAVGMIGSFLACLAFSYDWSAVISRLKTGWSIPGLFVSAWLASLTLLSAADMPVTVASHIVPTVLMLLSVYALSVKLNLPQTKAIQSLNETLARNMLFAYLFHIMVIRVAMSVIAYHGHPLSESLVMAVVLGSVTFSAGAALNLLTRRYRSALQVYELVFR